MKKILLYVLSVACLFAVTAFVACSGNEKDTSIMSSSVVSASVSADKTESSSVETSETFAVTIAINESDYGSVSLTRIENVEKGTLISVSGNKLIVGEVEIIAVPADDTTQYVFLFDKWSAPEKVVGNVTVTAYFTRATKVAIVRYTVTVENGTGSGEYEEGEKVTATATVPNGKRFVRWICGETEVSTQNPYVFEASENINLTAIFADVDIHEDAIEINTANQWFNFEEGLPEFASSDKALVFDYKATDKLANAGDDFSFTLWCADWTPPRLTDIMIVNVVNNTASVGSVKALENGWYRVVIPAKRLPINTLEHATGTETIGSFIFYEVNHAVLIDEVGFIDPDIRDDAIEFNADNQWFNFEEELPDFASSDKALVFDYKAIDKETNEGETFLFTLWGTDWSSVRRTELITVDVVNNTVSVGSVKELENGWHRIIIPASDLPINTEEGATGEESLGSFIFNEVNHAVLIDEVGFAKIQSDEN